MLGLKGIEAIHGRVQDKEILQCMGEQFNMVISRAFADLQTLLILSFPFLKKGGILLAMKSEVDSDEIRFLSKKEEDRYRLQKTVPFFLPFSSLKRSILLFEKQ
jgi:16S rRNA (guanine527-N7)-methyltransferase